MGQRVPVADDLLTTKLKGYGVKRLLYSLGIPLAPGTVAMLLNMPVSITLPLGMGGLIGGGLVFLRAPSSQQPHRWLLGILSVSLTPSEYRWQPMRFETDQKEYESYMESTDEENTRSKEESADETPFDRLRNTLVGSPNTADHLDFEYIRDDGVIVHQDGYAKMIHITPRPWIILDADQREAVLDKWQDVLMGTKFPFQIHQLPVPYDASAYVDTLEEKEMTRSPDEHPLLSHGRIRHTKWVEGVVQKANIRDRQHFITVSVQRSALRDNQRSMSILEKLMSPVEALLGRKEIAEEELVEEVNSRAKSMAEALPPTGLDPEIMTDGTEVKRVLYYYYQGAEPEHDLEHGWLSQPATSDTIDEDQEVSPMHATRFDKTG